MEAGFPIVAAAPEAKFALSSRPRTASSWLRFFSRSYHPRRRSRIPWYLPLFKPPRLGPQEARRQRARIVPPLHWSTNGFGKDKASSRAIIKERGL